MMKRDIFLSILSGLLLIFSFPKYELWIFAWFGFVPLFFCLKNKSRLQAFFLAYLTGIIFWLGIVYWLAYVTGLGMLILVLYLALYFGLFGLILTNYKLQITNYQLPIIPSAWVLLEYLRSHLFSGFPWALLGYSQYLNLPVIQVADITGVWGVSFLVMLVNVSIYKVISSKLEAKSYQLGSRFAGPVLACKGWAGALSCLGQPFFQKGGVGAESMPIWSSPLARMVKGCRNFNLLKFRYDKIYLPFLLLSITLVYGFFKLHPSPLAPCPSPLRIAVIQGNIPQHLKWAPEAEDFIIDKYLELSAQALTARPDLIIWPEASLPVVLEEEPFYFEKTINFVKKAKTPLLFGAVTSRDNFYNSALLLSPAGKLLNRYDKLHLVPFGEYIPLRKIFGFLEAVVPIGDFTAGREYTVFKLASGPVSQLASYDRQADKPTNRQTKFSVLICFEDLFPQLSRQFVKKGADFLVNITNDAWFDRTSSPYQHLQASVFRAVENRIFLVRSANTGVSAFINPRGKIISAVKDRLKQQIFIDGWQTQQINIWSRKNLSFYTRYGDIFMGLCLSAVLLALYARLRR